MRRIYFSFLALTMLVTSAFAQEWAPLDPPCISTAEGGVPVGCRDLTRCIRERHAVLDSEFSRIAAAGSRIWERMGTDMEAAFNRVTSTEPQYTDAESLSLRRSIIAFSRELARVRQALARRIAAQTQVSDDVALAFLASPTGEVPTLSRGARRTFLNAVRSMSDAHADGCQFQLDQFSVRAAAERSSSATVAAADEGILPEGSLLPCLSRSLSARLNGFVSRYVARIEARRTRGPSASILAPTTTIVPAVASTTRFGSIRTMPDVSEPALQLCRTVDVTGVSVPSATFCIERGLVSGMARQIDATQGLVTPRPVPDVATFLTHYLGPDGVNRSDCHFNDAPEMLVVPPLNAYATEEDASRPRDFRGVNATPPSRATGGTATGGASAAEH